MLQQFAARSILPVGCAVTLIQTKLSPRQPASEPGAGQKPARCQRTIVSGRMIVTALRTVDATAHLALQHDQLMSERRILCFKPALRLKERGNHVQQEGYQRDHSR